MSFNRSKCKAMVYNHPVKSISNYFKMGNQYIEAVQEFRYLGITISTKRLTNLYSRHFAAIIQKAKRRLKCTKHLGFHADGLRIETAIRMYKLMVRPILEYGAQILVYRNYYLSSNNEQGSNQFSKVNYI